MILEEIEELTVDLEETNGSSGSYDDTKIKEDIENLQEQINNIKVPTKLSELENDSEYITGYTESDPVFSSSPVANVTEEDISNWNNKSEFSGNYEDLSGKPTIPTIPTNISEFENDEGYLKEIPEGYATEKFVQDKIDGIEIPVVPDISNFITEADMKTAISTAIQKSITSVLESEF